MINAQSPAVHISAFQKLATGNGDKAITAKGGKLESIPANLGIFGRLMSFIKSGSSGKMNAETRAVFAAAMNKGFGAEIALEVMKNNKFDGIGNKALKGRDIVKMVIDAHKILNAAEIVVVQARIHALKKENLDASHLKTPDTAEGVDAAKKNRADGEKRLADAQDDLHILKGDYTR